ncbi:unnamed protein product, partial [Polarella glacialis]
AIHWGTRCLRYGPDPQVREGKEGEQIPWVYDFHRSEAEDNEMLHPVFRHYFDQNGLESSFRNRGRLMHHQDFEMPNHSASQETLGSSKATGSVSTIRRH